MIARSACMLALVIAWSGYLAGLHWLVASPDPWLVKSSAHKNTSHPVAKQRASGISRANNEEIQARDRLHEQQISFSIRIAPNSIAPHP
jgi:hypothetical protein